jgi:hypothetical protein
VSCYLAPPQLARRCPVMPSRPFSEQWEALRPRLHRFRTWLGTPERTHSLLVLLWPLVALVIAILVIGRASTAKELSDLMSAFASLIWAVVPITILMSFSQEIRAILSRIRKGKLFRMEFELDELQAKTEAAEISGTATSGDDRFYEHTITLGPAPAEGEIEEVLREAARSPKLGLMLLSTKIERAIRVLIADTPSNKLRSALRPRAMVEALASGGQLSQETSQAVGLFLFVRNRIVRGHDADDDEIARAIDSGTRLLRLLLSRPRPSPETAKGPDGAN